MIFNELNEDNFLLFAIKNYQNPQAVTKDDFHKDLNHFKYIKRLLKRYKKTGDLKTHLLINHFIVWKLDLLPEYRKPAAGRNILLFKNLPALYHICLA